MFHDKLAWFYMSPFVFVFGYVLFGKKIIKLISFNAF